MNDFIRTLLRLKFAAGDDHRAWIDGGRVRNWYGPRGLRLSLHDKGGLTLYGEGAEFLLLIYSDGSHAPGTGWPVAASEVKRAAKAYLSRPAG